MELLRRIDIEFDKVNTSSTGCPLQVLYTQSPQLAEWVASKFVGIRNDEEWQTFSEEARRESLVEEAGRERRGDYEYEWHEKAKKRKSVH